jgi:hypothetical protein
MSSEVKPAAPPAAAPPPTARLEVEAQYAKNKDLRSLALSDGTYDGIQIPQARLDGLDLRRANLQDANLTGANLSRSQAIRAVLTKAQLVGADLRSADLRDAQLNSADLSRADVRGCWFSPATNLKGTRVTGLKIDRRALRMLGADHGGLTAADLADLEVDDDQVKLTTSFGGFWTVLHLLAVTLFLLPYVAFLVRRYVTAQLLPCVPPDCVTLRGALWEYIVSGGRNEGIDWLALALFVLIFLYNVFRASLVYKARSLKLTEEAAGIPRSFVLRGYWRVAYYGCQGLVWLNLSLVLWHVYHFLGTPVPK